MAALSDEGILLKNELYYVKLHFLVNVAVQENNTYSSHGQMHSFLQVLDDSIFILPGKIDTQRN